MRSSRAPRAVLIGSRLRASWSRKEGIHERAGPNHPRRAALAPALAILVVLGLLAVLPHHVTAMPVWVSRVAALAILVSMAAVALTTANALWLRVKRTIIVLFAVAYVANTIAELGDMIGIITLHPPETRSISLLSSSLAIWVANVLTFSLLYWQIDRGGPYALMSKVPTKPDWLFPQAAESDDVPPDWRPMFLDYLSLGYNTATAFSPPMSCRSRGGPRC